MYNYNKSNVKIAFREFRSRGYNCARLETCAAIDTCAQLPLTVIGLTHAF